MHRVLIVDDRPDVRLLLRTRLGFETDTELVGEASTGSEAVTLVRGLTPGSRAARSDVLRLELGTVPLHQAITAFDTWTGLNVRVLEALERKDELSGDQLSGASTEELEALMSVYAHIVSPWAPASARSSCRCGVRASARR